jgi:hypothetical protein
MNWSVILVLALLVGFILSGTIGGTLKEGFATPRRADTGYATDGWQEDSGYVRDLRYSEQFVDVQGLGVASDFCRAVSRKGDPDSLHVACALGRRDGMDTLEYRSASKREGFQFSRDDYWRAATSSKRMDYCRILKDAGTGHWYPSCAVAGREGFKREEVRDTSPPPAIQRLLEAYEGILVWFRWQDDSDDYAQNAVFEERGRPTFPSLLRPEVSRGLQLNRWPVEAQVAHQEPQARHLRDYLRFGEPGQLRLDQTIQPRQIRAVACWVWWDTMEKGARILECSNGGRKDLMWLGIEGGGPDLPPARVATPALELPAAAIEAVGQLTEPARPTPSLSLATDRPMGQTATYVFEIWDEEQRIMRLESPQGAAKVGEWQHVVVTATDGAAWWPTWEMWVNGELVATRTDGRLSPALELTENHIGKGMRGCLQDFRIYNTPLTEDKLKAAVAWGKRKLHPVP